MKKYALKTKFQGEEKVYFKKQIKAYD